MLDQLRALAVFATVADAGSFRGAARRLGISASVVSHHVTSLERFLDTPLIYRSTRKLSLTAAGQQLAQSARTMLDSAQEGFGRISRESASPTGRLRITAPAILQYARFVTRVSTFMKHYPKVELSINFSDRQHNIVEEGLDLALRIGWLQDSSLKARKLVDGGLMLCASPHYLQEQPALHRPEDLTQLEMINLVGTPTNIRLQARKGRKSERAVRMSHRITVDSGFAAKRMAVEGCGLVMLPDFFLRDSIADGSLVEVLTDWRAPTFGIYAVWPDNAGTNALRTLFVNFVALIARTEEETDRQMVEIP